MRRETGVFGVSVPRTMNGARDAMLRITAADEFRTTRIDTFFPSSDPLSLAHSPSKTSARAARADRIM